MFHLQVPLVRDDVWMVAAMVENTIVVEDSESSVLVWFASLAAVFVAILRLAISSNDVWLRKHGHWIGSYVLTHLP